MMTQKKKIDSKAVRTPQPWNIWAEKTARQT